MKHADQLQLGCLWVIEPLWLNVTLVSLGNLYTLHCTRGGATCFVHFSAVHTFFSTHADTHAFADASMDSHCITREEFLTEEPSAVVALVGD